MFVHRFDAENAGVTTRAVEVAGAERGKEVGKETEGFLGYCVSL